MGLYSKIDILDKVVLFRLCYKKVLKERGEREYAPSYINALVCIRFMNRRGMYSNALSVRLQMTAVDRAPSVAMLATILREGVNKGWLMTAGSKAISYHITEQGKQLLREIDETVRRSHMRGRKKDPFLANKTGPKKGKPMPNRWKPGTLPAPVVGRMRKEAAALAAQEALKNNPETL